MNLILEPNSLATVEAPSYGVLLSSIACWKCRADTPTAAVWVPSCVEIDEDGDAASCDAALLKYIEFANHAALTHLLSVAPWLKKVQTNMSGIAYVAHHCTTCGAIQGDHFVFDPDGPYWPQDDAAIARLKFVAGTGLLRAIASAAQSAWIERVEFTP